VDEALAREHLSVMGGRKGQRKGLQYLDLHMKNEICANNYNSIRKSWQSNHFFPLNLRN